jgi:hypothetical protein
MPPSIDGAVDEQALAVAFPSVDRRARGIYFTPGPLVQEVLALVRPYLPDGAPLAVIDPACGAGAFLHGARQALPAASLHGLELSEEIAGQCRARLAGATVMCGDALRGALPELLSTIRPGAFELWLGNPPYNGTSSVLQERATYERLRRLLPERFALPRGTSLRDDYAFFLLLAARRLQERPGALAFVTSATLLDAFLYAPLRQALIETLSLREVLDLGENAFEGTRVRTCVTVWTSRDPSAPPPRYRARTGTPRPFSAEAPEWLLRPAAPAARRLEDSWRSEGEPLSMLIPISFPGLKTRFDELLVDADPVRLLDRVRAFLQTPAGGLPDLARRHGLDGALLPKLRALKAFVGDRPLRASPDRIRPFFRYAGERHRAGIPSASRAYCYLDRRLIPRGDHRLRGDHDPHACPQKLVFNARELPLTALYLDEPGCVTAHRHTRFAPLMVPWRLREQGLQTARPGEDLGPEVPNLSPRGLLWAERLGGPDRLFRALADFINSEPVQHVWAPAYGASRELSVPFCALR